MDLYIGMSQVFWFILIFLFFYLLIVKNILPTIAQSIKIRRKKIEAGVDSPLSSEAEEIQSNTALAINIPLSITKDTLLEVHTLTSHWLDKSLKERDEQNLSDINKNYIKLTSELKGRSYLIEEIIKK